MTRSTTSDRARLPRANPFLRVEHPEVLEIPDLRVRGHAAQYTRRRLLRTRIDRSICGALVHPCRKRCRTGHPVTQDLQVRLVLKDLRQFGQAIQEHESDGQRVDSRGSTGDLVDRSGLAPASPRGANVSVSTSAPAGRTRREDQGRAGVIVDEFTPIRQRSRFLSRGSFRLPRGGLECWWVALDEKRLLRRRTSKACDRICCYGSVGVGKRRPALRQR